jgi:hypothetical protein
MLMLCRRSWALRAAFFEPIQILFRGRPSSSPIRSRTSGLATTSGGAATRRLPLAALRF